MVPALPVTSCAWYTLGKEKQKADEVVDFPSKQGDLWLHDEYERRCSLQQTKRCDGFFFYVGS